MRGWHVITAGSGLGIWCPFKPYDAAIKGGNPGGGFSRDTFSLRQLYIANKKSQCTWTCGTDGYDVCRYLGTTIYLRPHPTLSYIFQYETDYRSITSYGWQWYHPAILKNRPGKVIVPSLLIKPNQKARKLKIKPPAIQSSEWYMMYNIENTGLFKWNFTFINLKDSYSSGTAGLSVQLTGRTVKTNGQQDANKTFYYYWCWDMCKDNLCKRQANPNENVADKSWGQDIPYWLSLWGWYNAQSSGENATATTIWLWVPETDNAWVTWSGPRLWFAPNRDSFNRLISAGPFVYHSRPTDSFSVGFSYKAHFEFGGPTPTIGISAGTDPKLIPPGYNAGPISAGVQARDPATVGDGVMHPWEVRRGILTKRGFKRLTQIIADQELLQEQEELPGNADPLPQSGGEREPWPSDEEPSSEEEDPPLSPLTPEEEAALFHFGVIQPR